MRYIRLSPAILFAATAAFIVPQANAVDIAPIKTEQVRAKLAKLTTDEKQQLAKAATDIAADAQNTTEERTVALRTLGLLQDVSTVQPLKALLLDATLGDEARIALQRIPGEATIEAFLEGLSKSQNEIFKVGIVESLGTLRAKKAVAPLAELVKGTPLLSEAAQRALASIATPAAFAALKTAADSELKSDLLLDAAAKILECPKCTSARGDVLAVLRQLSQNTSDADAVFTATLLRFRFQDDNVIDALRGNDANKKRAAAAFLGSSRDIESGKALEKAFAEAKDRELIPILGALVSRKQTSALPQLRSYVASEKDIVIKQELIKALGQLGDETDVPVFAQLLLKDATKDAATEALSQVRGAGVVKAYIDLIADGKNSKKLRMSLLHVAIRRPLGSDSVPGLIPVLGDQDEDVRLEALKAIKRFATKAQLDVLQKITSSDERITAGIAELVGKLKK
ncbi:MAG: hypothetical protein LBD01_04165 [Puniceicoccales bacterium]|jgi:HEAT repeat protein|nr:hypothetical protein [Puniceicoccales bacterium]